MKKIALLCFENPFLPPNVGGKIATLSHIQSLLLCGFEVDLFLLNNKNEKYDLLDNDIFNKIANVYQFQMRISPFEFFSPFPISVSRRFVPNCVNQLKTKKYDIAFYEGEHMMKYRLNNAIDAKTHVLYMHDIESAYRDELSKSLTNVIHKTMQKMESLRFLWLERMIDRLFDIILFISCEERDKLSVTSKNPEKYHYIPIPTGKVVERPVLGKKPNNILYVGDMSLYNNYLSVEWFVREVFVQISTKIPDTKLRLVGRISEEKKEKLMNISSKIIVLGYVDNIDKEFQQASLVVCPVLFGAGVKIKTIDALARGQLVVGTKKAIEGTMLIPDKHVLISEEADEFADKCMNVLKERERFSLVITGGWAYVKSSHSIKQQAELFYRLMGRDIMPNLDK